MTVIINYLADSNDDEDVDNDNSHVTGSDRDNVDTDDDNSGGGGGDDDDYGDGGDDDDKTEEKKDDNIDKKWLRQTCR